MWKHTEEITEFYCNGFFTKIPSNQKLLKNFTINRFDGKKIVPRFFRKYSVKLTFFLFPILCPNCNHVFFRSIFSLPTINYLQRFFSTYGSRVIQKVSLHVGCHVVLGLRRYTFEASKPNVSAFWLFWTQFGNKQAASTFNTVKLREKNKKPYQ